MHRPNYSNKPSRRETEIPRLRTIGISYFLRDRARNNREVVTPRLERFEETKGNIICMKREAHPSKNLRACNSHHRSFPFTTSRQKRLAARNVVCNRQRAIKPSFLSLLFRGNSHARVSSSAWPKRETETER